MKINYVQLASHHFKAIIALGNEVHGENYLDMLQMQDLYNRSWANQVNASWVAFVADAGVLGTKLVSSKQTSDGYIVGFRLTIAAGNWTPDKWCTPDAWECLPINACYFKSITVDSAVRGNGVASSLLRMSIESAKKQNTVAGVAHIWMQSPGNAAFKYFTACGGKMVKKHPNKWQINSIEDGYECNICNDICVCTAGEMILHFEPTKP